MKICLFDIDGTLITTGGAGKQAFLQTLQKAFGMDIMDPGVPFAGRTDRGIVSDLFTHFRISQTAQNWDLFTEVYLQLLPECLASCDGHVLPGIKPLLEKINRHSEIQLGLLTGNMAKGAAIKLQHYGLDHYFDFGGFGDQYIERDRVAQQALLEIHQRWGEEVAPEQIFVIGDTPADIRCGRAIGANTVGVCTGKYSARELNAESAHLVLEDFSAADPLLDKLNT
jgi:phosphoglycolate phosphatase